jgi:hypothetical protein
MGYKPRKMTMAAMIKKKIAQGPNRDDLMLAMDEDFDMGSNRPRLVKQPAP